MKRSFKVMCAAAAACLVIASGAFAAEKLNLMWGSTVMNVIGREVRAAENRLVQAEKAASLACIAL